MRLLIADHIRTERSALVQQCETYADLEEITTAASGAEAIEMIRLSRPDVVLLECDLQDMTGFDVLQNLAEEQRPAAIMLAADDRYAAQAFDSAAVDYLKRPITPVRVRSALKRANCLSHGRPDPGCSGVNAALPVTLGYSNRLMGERAHRLYFLAPDEVDYIEADSNYVLIVVGTDKYIKRDTLSRLLPLLEPMGFVKISRSVIVNLQRVKFAERVGRSTLAFFFASGVGLVSDAGYRLQSGAAVYVQRSRGRRSLGS